MLLLDRDRHLLCIDAALIVLGGNADDASARGKRSHKMPEFVSCKDSGSRLAIDHYNGSSVSRALDLNNATVLHDRGDVKSGRGGLRAPQ